MPQSLARLNRFGIDINGEDAAAGPSCIPAPGAGTPTIAVASFGPLISRRTDLDDDRVLIAQLAEQTQGAEDCISAAEAGR